MNSHFSQSQKCPYSLALMPGSHLHLDRRMVCVLNICAISQYDYIEPFDKIDCHKGTKIAELHKKAHINHIG